MPDDDRPVVVDTTPIITLALVGHLDTLQALYREILIPPAVREEILAGGPRGVAVAELAAATWIRVMPLDDPRRADLLSDLDRGEAEVLALAQEAGARLVILDERLARRHARRLRLTLTGTLGVLLRAKLDGHVDRLAPLITTMQDGGIYLGEALVQKVLSLAGESA